MVAIFCVSIFFPQKVIMIFFSFAHISNKIVKTKCKTRFSKLLKGYTFNIRHSKLRGFQKYIP